MSGYEGILAPAGNIHVAYCDRPQIHLAREHSATHVLAIPAGGLCSRNQA